MAAQNVDVIIIGAGIAGLWSAAHLKRLGYSVALLERTAIGSGQTIASQGIIHSGFKYTLTGQMNTLAQSISAMPTRWRGVLDSSLIASSVHHLMIPGGLIGTIMKMTTEQAFRNIIEETLPETHNILKEKLGFSGSVIALKEPVLYVPGVLQSLSSQCPAFALESEPKAEHDDKGAIKGLWIGQDYLQTKAVVYTSAESNMHFANINQHAKNLHTQTRPLMMAMMRPAPYPLFAHLVGTSDKPLATITTHRDDDGRLVWYIGGQVAERPVNDNTNDLFASVKKVFDSYIPSLDYSGVEWAAIGINRTEGKAGNRWLPDTPVIHQVHNTFYAWPTKLTFAPLLGDKIEQALKTLGIQPSGIEPTLSFLKPATIARAPWNTATWSRHG